MLERVLLRRGRVVALALSLALLVVVPAWADWDHVGNPDVGELLQDPAYLRSAQAAEAAYQADLAQRATAGEQRARDASETEYGDLSPAGAQDLAQQAFPTLMHDDLDALGLPHGVDVEEWLAPDVARLVNAEGKGSLLVGTEPLATEDSAGDLHRVDLSLASEGSDYAPQSPATDLTIPHQADDFLTLADSDVGLKPADAPAVTGLAQDDRVFYPDVAQDTDFVAMPTRGGAEIMWQLRSAQAAEALPLDLDLPAGASARLTSPLTAPVGQTVAAAGPGIEIVRDGTVLATMAAPSAFDADGTPVPASYRLDGDQLVVDVTHQDADVKYPIAVDPEVHEVYGAGDLQTQCAGWQRQSWGTPIGQPCYDSRYGGGGLYNESTPNTLYADGSYAAWSFGTPGYVHIISAWMDGMWSRTVGSHFFAGITSSIYGWEIPGLYNNAGDMMNANYMISGGPGYDMDAFQFGLQLDCCWNSNGHHDARPYEGLAAIRGVNIRLGDDTDPFAVGAPLLSDQAFPVNQYGVGYGTPNWMSSQSAFWANLTAQDAGLGLKAIGVAHMTPTSATNLTSIHDDYIVGSSANTCTGNRAGPCPMGASPAHVPLDLSSFNGIAAFHSYAADITDRIGHGDPWYMKLDRYAPNITFSGQIPDAGARVVGPSPTIHVDITDGSTYSPDQYQSGVRAVLVNLYDPAGSLVRNWSWSNPNTDATNNNAGLDYTLPTTANGQYKLTVDAFDDVGHYAPKTIQFTVAQYPTSWNLGGTDRTINTLDEKRDLARALQDASDAQYQSLVNGLSPTDRPLADSIDPCDPSFDPPLAVCAEPDNDTPIDAGSEDVPAELVPEDSGSQATTASTTAYVHRLQTHVVACETQRCWTSIRRAAGSWSLANVRLMVAPELPWDSDLRVTSTIAAVQNKRHYYFGNLSWLDGACGWALGSTASASLGDTSSGCAPDTKFSVSQFQLNGQLHPEARRPGDRWATRGNNCQRANGTYLEFKSVCPAGTAIKLVGPAVECANVYTSFASGTARTTCRSQDVIKTIDSNSWQSYCVNWRYVTKDGNWVMVNDTHRDNIRGSWVFIPVGALQPDRKQWPRYFERSTCNGEGW